MTRRARWSEILRHTGLALFAIALLMPFFIMVQTAFTPREMIFSGGAGLDDLTLNNFRTALAEAPWSRYFFNSVLITALIFIGQVAVCLPAGYALARRPMIGRGIALAAVLVAIIIPAQVRAVPIYVMFAEVGLVGSLASLIVPFWASAFGIYLFRQFTLSIPQSLFDAARLDGVGEIGLVWRVVLPNLRPAIAAFAVFSVVGHWNDLFWPSVMLRDDHNATVPYGIARFASSEFGSNFGAQMAAATIVVTPMILIFIATQRHFLRGVSLAGTSR